MLSKPKKVLVKGNWEEINRFIEDISQTISQLVAVEKCAIERAFLGSE